MNKILFICLGGICHSPMAEGIFRLRLDEAGFGERFESENRRTPAPRMPGRRLGLIFPNCVYWFRGSLGITKPRDVPDPYYGDTQDFVRVAKLLDGTAQRFLERLLQGA